MNQFTKGPWVIAFLTNYNNWRRGDESIQQPDPKEIGEAIDAAIEILTAATDLYEALQAMLEFPNAGPSHDMARAALSKATA